ncbi:MAG: DUF4315 family protein [Eubacteriales bacterium]|nr:DUF4315 family protein [Eubacteriales bacterium]
MKGLKKVMLDIERTNGQLAQLQERLRDLEAQRTQLENAEMIAAIRNANFDASEMLAVIQSLKKNGTGLSDLLALTTVSKNEESEESNHD